MNKESKFRKLWSLFPHPIRMLLVLIAGASTLLVGIALLVLPGPGIPLILLGLLILASEFAWAESILHKGKKAGNGFFTKIRNKVETDNISKDKNSNNIKDDNIKLAS